MAEGRVKKKVRGGHLILVAATQAA